MASSSSEDFTAEDVHAEPAEGPPTDSEPAPDMQRVLAVMMAQQSLVENVVNHLNQVTRTMSGYAEMLERHLSIQDDTVGSEYALGVRGELEQLHKLLFHLRPISRNRDMDPAEYKKAIRLLSAALSDT